MNSYESDVIGSGDSASDGGPMDSAWPMFQYDVHHTGLSPNGKSGNWFVEKWKVNIGDWASSSPAIDKDGTIYIGGGVEDKSLHAINPDGTKKWSFKTSGHIQSSPAIAEDGTIYVGSNDGNLYAINPNGTKKWSLQIGSSWVYSSPMIDDEGIIYIGAVGGAVGNICAVYPNGTKKWDTTLGGMVYCTPGLDNNGMVYIGSNDGVMYAIYTSNGTIKWKYGTGDKIGSAPTVDNNGIIYFGSNDGYLYALYPNGSTKWRFLTKENYGLVSSPAIDKNGNIIVGSGLGYVYSINPDDGTENWRFSAQPEISASPAIDKFGIIYVGTYDGMFYALNPDGTLKWKYKTLDEIFPSAAIGEDGTIYVGAHSDTFTAYLYAIEPIDDNPPEKPVIDGQTHGGINTEYTYTAVTSDPDNDNVSYYFDWGDGTNSGWTEYVSSGYPVSRSHSWNWWGTYTIKVKAKDVYDMESDWETLKVTMPKNKISTSLPFLKLLDMFPLLEKLLNLIN
jgi:outer membrane protein assembly factor BamB